MKSILLESGSGDIVDDFNYFLDSLGNSGWMIIIFSVIAIIAGIIAIILVKGNKKPKAAGITFIAAAVIAAIASFGIGVVGGIFYVIAGILCLTRKG